MKQNCFLILIDIKKFWETNLFQLKTTHSKSYYKVTACMYSAFLTTGVLGLIGYALRLEPLIWLKKIELWLVRLRYILSAP